MRGVRAILVLFAAMTLAEIVMLIVLSPRGERQVYFSYEWAWGLYLSLALGAAGIFLAARFGGRLPVAEVSAPSPEPTPSSALH
jgi:hypothetical protein